MKKVLLSVLFLVAIVIGGYFGDDGFHAKVAGIFHKSQVAAVQSGTDWNKAVTSATTQSSTGSLATILDKGTIRVSVQDPSKPFYYSENGRVKGFNVDFLNILLAQSEFNGKHITVLPAPVDAVEAVALFVIVVIR